MHEIIQKLNFSIDRIEFLQELSDSQLAIGRVWICCEGDNLHKLPITYEALENAIPTLYNKFLVAGFDGIDFEGHERRQLILGFFPKENDVKIQPNDEGINFITANVIISKLYADWAYDIFCSDNYRAVSMEILVTEQEERDGLDWITEFCFAGVTVLGIERTPACTGAYVEVTQFSTDIVKKGEKISKLYTKFSKDLEWTISKKIKSNVSDGLELKKENKFGGNTVSIATAKFLVGNDNITESKGKHFIKYAPKFTKDFDGEEITKEYITYMLWGGKEGKVLMEKIAKQLKEKEDNIETYFNSKDTLTIDDNDIDKTPNTNQGKEGNMLNTKFAEMTYNEKISLINQVVENNDVYITDLSDSSIYAKFLKEDKIYKIPHTINPEGEIEFSIDDKVEVFLKWVEKDEFEAEKMEDEKMESEEVVEDEKMESEEKAEDEKMESEEAKELDAECKSLEAESEDDEESEEGDDEEGDDEEDENENAKMEMKEKYEALEKKVEELEAYKLNIETQQKMEIINQTLMEATQNSEIPVEDIECLKAESENFSLENIEGWKNKVYSVAFKFSKKIEKEDKNNDIVKMGLPFTKIKAPTSMWDKYDNSKK